MLEVADPKKATLDYLLKDNVRFSWAKSSTEEKNATIGMRATNDPLEIQFATFLRLLLLEEELAWIRHRGLVWHAIIMTLDMLRSNM
jgi:hypothetical protein